MSSLSASGVSGPSPIRAATLSHAHGGHLIRRIRLASSILELDDVLAASKSSLRSEHIGAASLKLGELTTTSPQELSGNTPAPPKHLNQRQKIAHELDVLARHFAPRMVSSHIGGVLLGLSRSQHQLTDTCLNKLAARCIADSRQRLSVASDRDVKMIAQGFSRQRYRNPLLWDVLSSELLNRPNLDPSYMASVLMDLPRDLKSHVGIRSLATQLSAGLALKIQELPPAKCVSLLTWSTRLSDMSNETQPLLRSLMGKAGELISRLPPQQVALLAVAMKRVSTDLISSDVKSVLVKWLMEGKKADVDEDHSQHFQAVEQCLKAINIS